MINLAKYLAEDLEDKYRGVDTDKLTFVDDLHYYWWDEQVPKKLVEEIRKLARKEKVEPDVAYILKMENGTPTFEIPVRNDTDITVDAKISTPMIWRTRGMFYANDGFNLTDHVAIYADDAVELFGCKNKKPTNIFTHRINAVDCKNVDFSALTVSAFKASDSVVTLPKFSNNGDIRDDFEVWDSEIKNAKALEGGKFYQIELYCHDKEIKFDAKRIKLHCKYLEVLGQTIDEDVFDLSDVENIEMEMYDDDGSYKWLEKAAPNLKELRIKMYGLKTADELPYLPKCKYRIDNKCKKKASIKKALRILGVNGEVD